METDEGGCLGRDFVRHEMRACGKREGDEG